MGTLFWVLRAPPTPVTGAERFVRAGYLPRRAAKWALFASIVALHLLWGGMLWAEITVPPVPQAMPVAGEAASEPVVPQNNANSDGAPSANAGAPEAVLGGAVAGDIEECAEAARQSIKREFNIAAVGAVLLVLVFMALRHGMYTYDLGFRSPVIRFFVVLLLTMVAASGIGGAVRYFGTHRAGKSVSEAKACLNTVEANPDQQLAVGAPGSMIRVEKVVGIYKGAGRYSMPFAAGIGAGAGLVIVLIGLGISRVQYARRAKERA